MAEKEFPKKLYVALEDDGEGGFWRAEEQPHDLADLDEPRRKIGIYELVDMGELVTEVTMKPAGENPK